MKYIKAKIFQASPSPQISGLGSLLGILPVSCMFCAWPWDERPETAECPAAATGGTQVPDPPLRLNSPGTKRRIEIWRENVVLKSKSHRDGVDVKSMGFLFPSCSEPRPRAVQNSQSPPQEEEQHHGVFSLECFVFCLEMLPWQTKLCWERDGEKTQVQRT